MTIHIFLILIYVPFPPDVLRTVKDRFSIDIPSSLSLTFVHIPKKRDPSSFKRMTLVAESLDTIKLAWFALNKFSPHIFVDTTGCAFTFLVAKLARCTLVAYVHYPTVSTVSLHVASFYSKQCMSPLNHKAF